MPGEHVELGERDAGQAVQTAGLAHQHRVEPAAAPRAPGGRAELVAGLAQADSDVPELLGGKRTVADAGRVGLADPDHVLEATRPDAGARGDRARHGIGGRHVGIGAVVDVEHGALRAFEEDRRPASISRCR